MCFMQSLLPVIKLQAICFKNKMEKKKNKTQVVLMMLKKFSQVICQKTV